MEYSINLYFCDADSKQKIDEIKKTGYTQFFTGIYDKKESMTWKEQIIYAKQLGLDCTMIHCSYYEPDLHKIWQDGEDGEKIINNYIFQIENCGKYSSNFVVHLNNDVPYTPNEIGLRRIEKMLKACEKFNINLCIENLYSDKEIPYVFEHISHPLLKICYDSGHKNFLTRDFALCENYGKYISVLHLHENNGLTDEHKKLTQGSEVFERLTKELKLIPKDVALASEIKYKCEDWKQYLQDNLSALKILDKKINN